jgi:membrane-associated phospholipid phosphatase
MKMKERLGAEPEAEIYCSSAPMESKIAVQAKVPTVPHGLTIGARIIRQLAPHEILLLLFAVLLSLVAVLASSRVTAWPQVLVDMVIASGLIFAMSLWASLAGTSGNAGRWARRLRLLYLFPLIPIYFEAAGLISNPIHGHDFDAWLIVADRLIFGVNPTDWLALHFPTWPWLTEYLMICYTLFYFLPCALTLELYRRGPRIVGDARKKEEFGALAPFTFGAIRNGERPEPVEQVVFIVVYAFLLSYIGYILVPAIGPRFTLHNFLNLSNELPGVFLTEPLRTLLNRGEGVVPGMSIANIISHVNRDAFPSGHTDITLLTIVLAFQFRARVRWAIAIIGISLIFSTVYLRYHYVVDLLAAAVLAVITLYTWEWVRERMLRIRARFVMAP